MPDYRLRVIVENNNEKMHIAGKTRLYRYLFVLNKTATKHIVPGAAS